MKTTLMSKYQSLDDAILARVKNRRPLAPMTHALIMAASQVRGLAEAAVAGTSRPAFRAVDARLQALRKKGLIEYSTALGWSLRWPYCAVVEPADSPMPVVEPAQQVQAEQPRRMSLWSINQLLAPLELSHQTLADLGFYPTYPLGATLASHPNYSAGDFPKICQTISDLAAAAAWDLAAAAAWESQETAEREAYEAAQRKEDAKREDWRAEMRRDVYGEPK